MVEALTLILLFTIGYAALRTSVCMVMAAREIVIDRRANRLTGFLLAAAFSALAMAASMAFGRNPFTMILGYPASGAAIAGGALFAVGAAVNGRCAMGTLAALASGELRHIATLIGMIAAAGFATPIVIDSIAAMAGPPRTPSLLVYSHVLVTASGASIITILLSALLVRNLRRARTPKLWSPLFAMSLIGMASGLLFAIDQQWPYTSLITALAAGETADAARRIGLALVLLAAMTVSAWRGGIVRLNLGTAQKWAGATFGGLLMGIGASLVPGGNDAMLMTGVPLLLPNLIVAYISMIIVLVTIEWMRFRRSGV